MEPSARQFLSSRVVVGRSEQRLSQLSGEIRTAEAQYCVVLNGEGVRVVGLIRFGDVAAKTETSTRILSDLMTRPLLASIRETDSPAVVHRIFELGGPQEIVVTSSESDAFVGLITPESFSVWLLRNEQLRKAELEL